MNQNQVETRYLSKAKSSPVCYVGNGQNMTEEVAVQYQLLREQRQQIARIEKPPTPSVPQACGCHTCGELYYTCMSMSLPVWRLSARSVLEGSLVSCQVGGVERLAHWGGARLVYVSYIYIFTSFYTSYSSCNKNMCQRLRESPAPSETLPRLIL